MHRQWSACFVLFGAVLTIVVAACSDASPADADASERDAAAGETGASGQDASVPPGSASGDGGSADADAGAEGGGPVDLTNPHEPAGFVPLYDRPFDALNEQGWGFRDYTQPNNNVQGAQIAIVSDPTAPRSGPSVLQFTYPSGFPGGGEPAKTWREFSSSELSPAMYTSIWVKFSQNWDGHLSTVNKVAYWDMTQGDGRARLFVLGRGSNDGTLRPELVTQGTPLGDQRLLPPNLQPSAQLVRGQWHRIETIVRLNTGASYDGQVHMWLDGTKVLEYDDVVFVDAAELHQLTGFEITPVWGGVNDQIGAQAQQLSVDHLYLSRAP